MRTAAIVLAVRCRKAMLASCRLPDTGQEYSLQAPSFPSGPQICFQTLGKAGQEAERVPALPS